MDPSILRKVVKNWSLCSIHWYLYSMGSCIMLTRIRVCKEEHKDRTAWQITNWKHSSVAQWLLATFMYRNKTLLLALYTVKDNYVFAFTIVIFYWCLNWWVCLNILWHHNYFNIMKQQQRKNNINSWYLLSMIYIIGVLLQTDQVFAVFSSVLLFCFVW